MCTNLPGLQTAISFLRQGKHPWVSIALDIPDVDISTAVVVAPPQPTHPPMIPLSLLLFWSDVWVLDTLMLWSITADVILVC